MEVQDHCPKILQPWCQPIRLISYINPVRKRTENECKFSYQDGRGKRVVELARQSPRQLPRHSESVPDICRGNWSGKIGGGASDAQGSARRLRGSRDSEAGLRGVVYIGRSSEIAGAFARAIQQLYL